MPNPDGSEEGMVIYWSVKVKANIQFHPIPSKAQNGIAMIYVDLEEIGD